MTLWFDLMVNDEKIANVEITRMDDEFSIAGPPDLVYRYRYAIVQESDDGRLSTHKGTIWHGYDDGALALVAAVLDDHELNGDKPL